MSQLDAIEQERAKIKEQLTELDKKEAAILKEERPTIITRINAEIARYKIKSRDLQFEPESQISQQKTGNSSKKAVPAKYKNPRTDETWSGRGTRPNWVPQNKEEREMLRIPGA